MAEKLITKPLNEGTTKGNVKPNVSQGTQAPPPPKPPASNKK